MGCIYMYRCQWQQAPLQNLNADWFITPPDEVRTSIATEPQRLGWTDQVCLCREFSCAQSSYIFCDIGCAGRYELHRPQGMSRRLLSIILALTSLTLCHFAVPCRMTNWPVMQVLTHVPVSIPSLSLFDKDVGRLPALGPNSAVKGQPAAL